MDAYKALYDSAVNDPSAFWGNLAETELDWFKPFDKALDWQPPFVQWFTGGKLNVAYNCVERHTKTARKNKAAIIFEGEPGDQRIITYQELHRLVCRFASSLQQLGLKAGDRSIIYMPMIPEAAIAMLACARIGVTHSVVFGGFSAEALKARIQDLEAKVVLTADGGWRRGKEVRLKDAVDEALKFCPTVEHCVVYKRTGSECHMESGRDHWWNVLDETAREDVPAAELDSEHPLYVLYTSGTTGKPKGILHTTGGYLLQAQMTMKWIFDLKESDTYWCTADVGWVTGHSYVVYGPLAAGATTVIYEGAPDTPAFDRWWRLVDKYKVSIFYTSPTAIRALIRQGDHWPERHNLSSIRLLGSVGEPINPAAWEWFHRIIGNEKCPIVDTWWQTETGAIMISPIPGVTATKPGSCTRPLPGVFADIVDDEGRSVTTPDAGGYLVIRKPWPSMLRTIWGDNDRYLKTYWEKFQNRFYVAGDSAHRDADGYFWIMGRIDDVLNVAGHRLGTMEIESALVAHPRIAEAAVVGKQHDIKGESVFAFVVCRGTRPSGDTRAFEKELRD
jgi:acetyl-CoA synthetase